MRKARIQLLVYCVVIIYFLLWGTSFWKGIQPKGIGIDFDAEMAVVPEPDSFFFIHATKTGTSLFTLLRNSLGACTEKNFTCFGVWGGGFWGQQMKNKKPAYPYNAKIMFGSNITQQEARRINTCNGKLPQCEGLMFHCPYRDCGKYKNKVTMIRNPYKWLPSLTNTGGGNI